MIYFPTSNPATLLNDIKSAIDQGKIKTWSYDDDGDFTHATDQWNQRAWLSPIVQVNSLDFCIFPPLDVTMSKAVYAVYHGRFIEAVLRHFDTRLSGNASASALPVNPDKVG